MKNKKQIKVMYVSDYFMRQVLGGAEICGKVLTSGLVALGFDVFSINSDKLTPEIIDQTKHIPKIIGNFSKLSEEAKKSLKGHKYVLYVHDHPYEKTRNPAKYPKCKVPGDKLVNVDFIDDAVRVFGQGRFHCRIMRRNLPNAVIESLGGNLWDDETLDFIIRLTFMQNRGIAVKTNRRVAIMKTKNWHKNVEGAIKYCHKNELEFGFIPYTSQKGFLSHLSKYGQFFFHPLTPETFSRITIEAKMLSVDVIINENVGAQYEPWFDELNGNELVEFMREKRGEIVKRFARELRKIDRQIRKGE